MKKKKRTILIILSFFFFMIITGCSKFNNSSFSFEQVQFYTILEENNSKQYIYVEFNDESNPYDGKLYIPGNYTSPIYLFWTIPGGKNIEINNYETGQYQLGSKPYLFEMFINDEIITFSIEVIRTSPNIEPLFLNINGPLGLIDDMNNDWNHNTNCYGKASFCNETHYISIKGRGNSTWTTGLKKPYNITFHDKEYINDLSVSMIDGIETSKWSLLANYGDPSLLRNKIGYDLANKMSVGLDSKYYDVWMNGNFLGNYLVTPKNDYQATKNGYILELDNNKDNVDPQFKLKVDGKENDTLLFTVKNNNASVDVKEIESYMQDAWEAIKKYDSDEYLKYIDVDSWAKLYLLNEINKNHDIVHGSILMHRDGLGQDDKLIAGPIWDLDNALGTLTPHLSNGHNNETMFSGGFWYISSINWRDGDCCFYQELGKHKDFMQKVNDIYLQYREIINDLPNQINLNVNTGYDSFLADFTRWGNDRTLSDFYTDYDWNYGSDYPVDYQATHTYDDYLQNLIKYVVARVSFLDNNVGNIQ